MELTLLKSIKHLAYPRALTLTLASLVAQMVKSLPTVRKGQVQSLGWEAHLEEGMTTHSSILAWKNPVD